VNRHDFLSGLHERIQPRTYIEIGVSEGRGIARSHCRTIGVDPAFRVTSEVSCDLQLVKATSDDFFARPRPLAWFEDRVSDLTFIDGMHLLEYAFRDFINAERHSGPASVIVFDDMLPRATYEAARDRYTVPWTGDVFKIVPLLEQYRPDLTVITVDVHPTGVTVVTGLDPTNTVLADRYDEIVAEYVTVDPQLVPTATLHRSDSADPEQVLDSGAWADLVQARSAGEPADSASATLAALRGTATYVWQEPGEPKLLHPAKPAAPRPANRTVAQRIGRKVKRRLTSGR
jgi:hypothetical protein